MAVYTEIPDEEFDAFMAGYDLGAVLVAEGHRRGRRELELPARRPSAGQFILTLYEKRVDPADLPFFLGLMEHLAGARHHLSRCPSMTGRATRSAGSPGGRRRS